MKWSKLKQKKWFRIMSNKYLLISLFFLFWMLFLDSNSYLVHRELDEQIDELQHNKRYYQKEVAADETLIENLNDEEELEKYAREKYFMKRENEDVFIVEYKDSLNNQTDE